MQPKPKHLGKQYAEQFQDAAVVAAYHHRPEYPPETFDILANLIEAPPGRVLDIGCGTGFIARHLVGHEDSVESVEAVDFSVAMVEQGKRLPNGDHPRLHWIVGSVESAPLHPPYSLITAGQSLNWMEWEQVFPRFRSVLSPTGPLAIAGMEIAPTLWDEDLLSIISRYSTNRDFRRTDLVAELAKRKIFTVRGEVYTDPELFEQPVEDYVESFHARNGFSRERMTPAAAGAFDSAAHTLVSAHCPDGTVRLHVRGHVVWGRPHE